MLLAYRLAQTLNLLQTYKNIIADHEEALLKESHHHTHQAVVITSHIKQSEKSHQQYQ